MISAIFSLVERTCKLLNGVYECLNLQISKLKHFSKRLRLILKHSKRYFNHVLLNFILYNFDLADRLIVCLQNSLIFTLLIGPFIGTSSTLASLLLCRPCLRDSIHMIVNFSEHFILVSRGNFGILINVKWDHSLLFDDQKNVFELTSSDEGLQIRFFILKDLIVNRRIPLKISFIKL